jgi:hypothetical protein
MLPVSNLKDALRVCSHFVYVVILTSFATGSRRLPPPACLPLVHSNISANLLSQLEQAQLQNVSNAPWKRNAHTAQKRAIQIPLKFKRISDAHILVYLDPVANGNTGWPAETLVDGVPDIENITEALKTGPYGLCVYESANDVCDHQVVNMEFSDGSTASFTMVAYTSLICDRQLRMHFTQGEIVGDMNEFTITDFRKKTSKVIHPKNEGGGHGGGDRGLIRAFVEAVSTGNQAVLGTDVGEVLKSHLTVFAAEASRKEGRVVDCAEFEKSAREKLDKNHGKGKVTTTLPVSN